MFADAVTTIKKVYPSIFAAVLQNLVWLVFESF